VKNYLSLAALALCFGLFNINSTQAQINNNTIYACYQKENGQLRRVSGPGQCRPSEVPISWSVSGVPGLQGPKGDKGEPGTPAPFPSNVIIVAKSGGHFTSVQAAVDSITDASDNNRYLVWVAPGNYDEVVTLKDFVGLQGAGENLTKLISSDPNSTALTVPPSSSTRDLTVEAKNRAILTTGGALTNVTAIVNTDQPSPIGIFALGGARLDNVTVKVSSTFGQNFGSAIGMLSNDAAGVSVSHSRVEVNSLNASSSGGQFIKANVTDSTFNAVSTNGGATGILNSNQVSLDNVIVTANSNSFCIGYGYITVFATPQQSTIRDSSITAGGTGVTYGIYVARGLLDVQNSQISASTDTINVITQATVRVSQGLLGGGPAINGSGTILKCSAITDENYDFFANTCP
jgi:hypothetical protein